MKILALVSVLANNSCSSNFMVFLIDNEKNVFLMQDCPIAQTFLPWAVCVHWWGGEGEKLFLFYRCVKGTCQTTFFKQNFIVKLKTCNNFSKDN